MARFFGNNFPFYSDTSVLPLQEDERLIKNDIKQLLLTNPEERVMRPTYGTPIGLTIFNPNDEETIITLSNAIRVALDRFESRVKFRDVRISTNADQSEMRIIVYVALTRDPNRILNVEVNVTPGSSTSQPQQAV